MMKLRAGVLVFLFSLILLLPMVAGADPPPAAAGGTEAKPQEINLLVPIRGQKTIPASTGPSTYIALIFTYALGLAALLALAQLVFGAVQFTASAGLPSLREDAKNRMTMAIWGLILLLITVVILNTIKTQNFLVGPTLEPVPDIGGGTGFTTPNFDKHVLSKVDSTKSKAEQIQQFMNAMRDVMANGSLSLAERGRLHAEAMRYILEGNGPFGSNDPTVWKTFGNAMSKKEFKLQALSALDRQAMDKGGFDWGDDTDSSGDTENQFMDALITELEPELGFLKSVDPDANDIYDSVTQRQRLAIIEQRLAEKNFSPTLIEQERQAKLIVDYIKNRDDLSEFQKAVKSAHKTATDFAKNYTNPFAVPEATDALKELQSLAKSSASDTEHPWLHQEAEAALRDAVNAIRDSGMSDEKFDNFIAYGGADGVDNDYLRPNPNFAVFEGYATRDGTVLIPKTHLPK